MKVNLFAFDIGIWRLIFVVEAPEFDYDNWSTAVPLLHKFTRELRGLEHRSPGLLGDFKLSYQYVLNVWTEEKIEKFVDSRMNFGMPEPVKEFLIFVWEHAFPDEPWQRTFPQDLQEVWEHYRA